MLVLAFELTTLMVHRHTEAHLSTSGDVASAKQESHQQGWEYLHHRILHAGGLFPQGPCAGEEAHCCDISTIINESHKSLHILRDCI